MLEDVHKNKSLSQAIYDEALYIVSQKQN